MAEGVLFEIAKDLVESLGKSAFKEVSSWWGTKSELKKLQQTLEMIKAGALDAEKYHENERSAAIKVWLRRLKVVFFKADDLFDEVFTAEQRKLRIQGNMAMKVRLLFSDSSPLLFSIKVAGKIKSIRQELDAIKSDMSNLNLRIGDHRDESQLPFANLMMSKRETTSFVRQDDVIGRHDDKTAILIKLFDPKFIEERLSVIPIVGFGGIGKTTLAQLVLNDDKVKNHFELTEWACVPEIDNLIGVMRTICISLTGLDRRESRDLSLAQLQSRIREAISNKRYLLVLDDIWDENRDRWLQLKGVLDCGGTGSKIIVTTRSKKVATAVRTVPDYDLGLLTDEESWELFRRIALKEGQEEGNPNFTRIGKEILDRCGRVPLAIKVIGSLLYNHDTEQEWLLFQDDHLAKTIVSEEDNIMPLLKLSYDFLPLSPLKQCFAYCSSFPKDYRFEKNELVRHWMAQGYIKASKKSHCLEELGEFYFLELLKRNFFQEADEDDRYNRVYCKMHDLLHDLALHVAGVEDELEDNMIRSLLCSNSLELMGMISRFQSLRALELQTNDKTLPDCIGRLRHLRYLNLCKNYKIEYLPDGVTKLENLQTLNLDGCFNLKQLPKGFTKLANLRHLGLDNCKLNDMPSGFEKMRSLRELSMFVVGKSNGVDALTNFELRGVLNIVFFNWRKDMMLEAKRLNFKESQQLTHLNLSFNFGESEVTPSSGDMELLFECLMFPPNLKSLIVKYFPGESFPRRMVEDLACLLPGLVHVTILGCGIRQIPRFGNLLNLKTLRLYGLKALEYIEECGWGDDGEPCSTGTYFPALESLALSRLPEVKGWWSRIRVKDEIQDQQQQAIISQDHKYLNSQQLPLIFFPCLSQVVIRNCFQLLSFPAILPKVENLTLSEIDEKLLESILISKREAPSSSSSSSVTLSTLKTLEISTVNNLVSFSIDFCNLEYLEVSGCKELTSLIAISQNSSIRVLDISYCERLRNVYDGLQHLSALEELIIRSCEELDLWETTTWPHLRSLRSLDIRFISKLEVLPSVIGCLQSLKKLHIYNLKNLTGLPEEIGHLSQLHRLFIDHCSKLASLPQSLRSLSSLQQLVIWSCEILKTRCEQPNGEDWPLIQHIPNRDIR